ncbi:MAG: PH domain-containing protein [Bacilli bacterium]|nr:PH domain-containing protein [Bacilli bacterium]
MSIYSEALKFMKKYSGTLAFRLKRHCEVLESHLNPDEKVTYVFAGQKNYRSIEIPNTFVVALTTKRLLLARKRMLFGYFFYAITPDMFNDLKVNSGIIWGKIIIDTVKEISVISNVDKSALSEIETMITEYMMKEKKKYAMRKDSK